MTVLCGGGTSSSKPEFGDVVYLAPGAIGGLLNNIPTPWAVALGGYIGHVTYQLSQFCSTDPPAVPTFTAQDVIDLLNPYNPFTYNAAQTKFQDLIGAFMWGQVCKCDNGTIPTSPTPPAEPTGMPSINPPAVAPSYPVGAPCQTLTFSGENETGYSSRSSDYYPLNGATWIEINFHSQVTVTTSGQFGFNIAFASSPGHFVGSGMFSGVSGSSYLDHVTAAVPSGALYFVMTWGPGGTVTPPITWDATVNAYCGTTPGGDGTGPIPQPCPADPFVQATLDQILALVTIIQRQQVPFAYVPGAVHSGLTGDGHFDVQGLIGLKLQVDSYGSAVGQLAGDPMEFYDAGWFAWGGPDGYSTREFITHSPQISLPAAAGQYTSIGYSLGHDVEVTITELVRES